MSDHDLDLYCRAFALYGIVMTYTATTVTVGSNTIQRESVGTGMKLFVWLDAARVINNHNGL